MDTKKVVVKVYGQNYVRYAGEVVVEAPQCMDEEEISELIMSNFHRIPEPDWIEEDEEGVTLSDDCTDIYEVADSDDKPSVKLTEGEDGDIRIFVRKKQHS
jgi:hypothetical protein